MNLAFIIVTACTAGATIVIAQQADKMIHNQGLRGFSALVPTVSMTLAPALLLTFFGDYFIDRQLVIWPVLIAVAITCWAAISQRR